MHNQERSSKVNDVTLPSSIDDRILLRILRRAGAVESMILMSLNYLFVDLDVSHNVFKNIGQETKIGHWPVICYPCPRWAISMEGRLGQT